eukprot:366360-Chlamydomonas_euryale.AAC.19
MPNVTLPEIQRTSLVSAVLYLKSLELGDLDVLTFDFLDAPTREVWECGRRDMLGAGPEVLLEGISWLVEKSAGAAAGLLFAGCLHRSCCLRAFANNSWPRRSSPRALQPLVTLQPRRSSWRVHDRLAHSTGRAPKPGQAAARLAAAAERRTRAHVSGVCVTAARARRRSRALARWFRLPDVNPHGSNRCLSAQALEDALRQLHCLDAIDENGAITAIGRRMSGLPLDPALARALLAAADLGCVEGPCHTSVAAVVQARWCEGGQSRQESLVGAYQAAA